MHSHRRPLGMLGLAAAGRRVRLTRAADTDFHDGTASMSLHVMFFAHARECAGVAETTVECGPAAGCTVADLRMELLKRYPGLAPIVGSLVFAVNSAYAGEGYALAEGDEVAVIPPVSGG